MKKRKVLVFDIETAPMTVYVFGRRDQNISLDMIKKDWYVLAWSAKWFGEPASTTVYHDLRKARNPEDDKTVLGPMLRLLDKADVVITQNGKKFDSRKLNARFILQGMRPPSPYEHWDTLRVANTVAAFTSNSLEYLSHNLCTKYQKLKHRKYAGLTLWKECMAGNRDAWNEMKKYNIHDVLSTEELCTKLLPWAPKNTPFLFEVKDIAKECGACGGNQVQTRGYSVNKMGRYPRYHCQNCGTWSHGKRIKGVK